MLLAVAVLVSSVIASSAEVIYTTDDGYSYTLLSGTTASLYGWDDHSTDLVIPSTLDGYHLTEIDSYAFDGNENITSADFSHALTIEKINYLAFRNCVNLAGTVSVSGHLSEIGFSAFEGCSSLQSVQLHSNQLTVIPNQCFYKCASLTEVILPESLETINKLAFANCTSLEYIEIPDSVTSIAASAFNNDTNLTLGVWYNSYAHTFAKNNNIPYVLLDNYVKGDADGNDYVSISDVTAIQRHIAEFETLDELRLLAADVTLDGVVDINDATYIQRYLAEYEDAVL